MANIALGAASGGGGNGGNGGNGAGAAAAAADDLQPEEGSKSKVGGLFAPFFFRPHGPKGCKTAGAPPTLRLGRFGHPARK